MSRVAVWGPLRAFSLPQQPDSAEGPGKETGKKNSVKTVFQGTVAKTRAWLQSIFQESMFFSYWPQVTFRYREEIKVSCVGPRH